ncbi:MULTISPECIES: hypothetical protein [Flavobacterium]|uniref:Uncharacterized protein n=1 Tax=Flavobacterium jumunjinense TaxID=998845 RepID=A0ABV5GVG4_9FLAO|nr:MULTISPECIES: hypothetical protein [Flavobacterium]
MMNYSEPKNLIYSRLFLITVVLLLLNDLYLKYYFHNYITGKLSDFVGLFAFPFFVSLFFKNKNKLIYIMTGILFVFWKSTYSQFIIDSFNEFGIGINRVVDYSDVIALVILPFSYHYRKQRITGIEKLSFIPQSIIIGVCCFAFIATSLPSKSGEINLKSDYEAQVEMPKDTVLKKMFRYYQNSNDPYYEVVIELPENKSRIFLSTRISELENNKTKIELDSILYFETESSGLFFGIKKKNVDYVKKLKVEDFKQLFVEQEISKLKK